MTSLHFLSGGLRVLALCLLAVTTPTVANAASLSFEWDPELDAAQRERLERWVIDTQAGVEKLVGPLDGKLRIDMRRHDAAREPVPWARTLRSLPQGVRFHVDPAYPIDAFYDDWTAAHELSHLILPFLGASDAWFAEGFASYLQYPVMAAMQRIDAATAARRMQRNIDKAHAAYMYPDIPFAIAADELRRDRRYAVMYWGGAVYFQRVDAALRSDASSLLTVLRDYVACCRSNYDDLETLIAVLDRVAGKPVFSLEHRRLMSEPGFPRAP